jgi:hypothetical protein
MYPRLITQIDSNNSQPKLLFYSSYPNFESKFGFLVKFYPFPELGLKKSAYELKKKNLYTFFSFLDHCAVLRDCTSTKGEKVVLFGFSTPEYI